MLIKIFLLRGVPLDLGPRSAAAVVEIDAAVNSSDGVSYDGHDVGGS